MENGSIREQKSRKKIILFLILILLVVVGFLLYKNMYRSPSAMVSTDVPSGEFAKKLSSSELEKYLQDKADKNYMRIQMNPTLILDAKGDLSLKIVNSPKNMYSVRVITSIEGVDGKIYDSGIIQPGEYVEQGRLSKKVDKGINKTISKVMYYNDKQALIGQSNVKGQLSVS